MAAEGWALFVACDHAVGVVAGLVGLDINPSGSGQAADAEAPPSNPLFSVLIVLAIPVALGAQTRALRLP